MKTYVVGTHIEVPRISYFSTKTYVVALEVPRRGASNEYPQHMFLWRNKKNIYLLPTLI